MHNPANEFQNINNINPGQYMQPGWDAGYGMPDTGFRGFGYGGGPEAGYIPDYDGTYGYGSRFGQGPQFGFYGIGPGYFGVYEVGPNYGGYRYGMPGM